ncbi:MAG: hypothetical protein SFW66_09380 [Gammaproteobacteria bacterium]|nr:hypothetical protein [Gammaproteobacteria bacterium]
MELSIVVPVYQEAQNIKPFLKRIEARLSGKLNVIRVEFAGLALGNELNWIMWGMWLFVLLSLLIEKIRRSNA